jgi:VPDSG-CTERM motif
MRHFFVWNSLLARALLFYFANQPNMKINIIPTNKLAMLSAAVCAVMLAFTNNASADATLTFTDTHVVGTITPANPADPGDVSNYINFMIALAPGGSGTFDPGQNDQQFITRSTNLFGSLPAATDVGSVSGQGTTVNLTDLGTFTYLFAKYDGQNDISVVWNITGLTGIITIPGFGPNGYALSGWILFDQTGPAVPDGGTTVMLLGAALGALGMARRFLKS